MPLVTHLLDEWGDIQFLFSNFSMDAVPMGEIPQQSFYRLHDLDVPFCRCILGVGHVVGHGGWWFHVRSFERHVFVGFIDGRVVL